MSEGTKHDGEKVQLELLSASWLMGVGRVLTAGARKYSAHNWRKGLEISRLIGAALRHLLAFLGGETLDPETGLSHLHHASCCLMFASELMETHPHLDDRWKSSPSATPVATSSGPSTPADTVPHAKLPHVYLTSDEIKEMFPSEDY